jgi:hypothetical protein
LAERPPARLIRSSAESASRRAAGKVDVARALDPAAAARSLREAANPPSLAGAMRKAGVALIALPDPITGVPGVALLASSWAAKRKEPAGIESLAVETRRALREIQSLGL